MVFPVPGPLDPRALVVEHPLRVDREPTVAEWADAENASGRHRCRCGCGGPIVVLERHRWHGIPQFLRGHHPSAMTLEVVAIRNTGFFTTADASRALGIGVTTLRRLEGVAYRPVRRVGKRQIRVFTERQVERLRRWLGR